MEIPSSRSKKRDAARSNAMAPDDFTRLRSLIKARGLLERPTKEHWRRTERMLRVELPASHKRVVSAYGTGIFGGRLLLLNPAAEEDWRAEFSARWVHGVASMLSGAIREAAFYPDPNGLLPIGMTQDSHYLCLVPSSPNPDKWTIAVCSLLDRRLWAARHDLPGFLYRLFALESRHRTLDKEIYVKLRRLGPEFEPQPYF